jgi:hypothetical protein
MNEQTDRHYVGFEVLTAVFIKSAVLWDIMPYSMLRINRHYGGTCCLHLQVLRINHTGNQNVG